MFPFTSVQDKRKTRKGLTIPWEFSNLAQITWGELAQKTTQQSKERGEKQAHQHAETGSRVSPSQAAKPPDKDLSDT